MLDIFDMWPLTQIFGIYLITTSCIELVRRYQFLGITKLKLYIFIHFLSYLLY
ncbi:hypothetical protein Lalb_Chr23g0265371 [Lupinus albus]|uniref:Uncharacterized protein n=1 Tax=Lupinus albus TaxID=3870 RepID=A0A6A4N9K9_LUPAL|nr:hypothetical protein Lalb_Chr23g0265371 [Lupinus albus]